MRACLISQTTSSNNNTIHFYNFHRESVEYRMCCLTIFRKNVPLLNDHLRDSCLQCSVTLCDVDRFGLNHLHKLAKGLPSYILRMGSRRTDSRDVYGVTRRVLMTMSFGKGTQLRWGLPVLCCLNAGAGGGCWLVFLELRFLR